MNKIRYHYHEVFRKIIHISGFFIIILCKTIGVYVTGLIIVLITGLYCISELLRLKGVAFHPISDITGLALRRREIKGVVTAPIYYALAIMLSLLFPEPINYAAVAIVTLGDGAAALGGTLYGRTPLPHNREKTWEGTLTGFIFAVIGSLLFISPFIAFVGSLVGITVESFHHRVNDTILIAVSSSIFMLVCSLII